MQLPRIAQYRAALRAGYTEEVWALLRGAGTAGGLAARQGVTGHRLGVVALVPAFGAPTGSGVGAVDLERVRAAFTLHLSALHDHPRTAVPDLE